MTQLALSSDKHWYAIDVYEQRGRTRTLVKILAKGPFVGTPDAAEGVFLTTTSENPGRKIVGHLWDAGTSRWVRWH